MTPIRNKHLKEVCTLGIGGPSEEYIEVHTIEEMQLLLKDCYKKEKRFFILGKGSNTLFDDKGFCGLVIHNKIDFFQKKPDGLFYSGAGYSFSLLGVKTARNGWSGLEFASGIPGTVGGAVFMNAGANGMETCDYLKSVDFITEEGDLRHYEKETLEFSYRYSQFQEMKGAIVAATFQLEQSDTSRTKQLEIINYRTKTQPYGEKSAGCIFRNPKSESAGALIEKCGLKGLSIGGARVSSHHANFIINTCKSSSEDVVELIKTIQKRVKKETGVELESEVQLVPYRISS